MNYQISDIGKPRERIRKNEYRIPLVDRVAKKNQRTDQAQPPERLRHHDALLFFRHIPLNDEPRRKNHVAQPADDLPDAPVNAEKFSVMPDEIGEPVHKFSAA